MKVLKIILVGLWVLSTTLFLGAALTPLEFRSNVLGYVTFFLAFNGIFYLKFLLSDFIKIKTQTAIIVLVISVTLALTYTYLPGINRDWKTQEIIYREKENPNNVIAFQMEKQGNNSYDHRRVKLIRITPVYDWVIEIKNGEVNEEKWKKVSEYVDEMGIKGK